MNRSQTTTLERVHRNGTRVASMSKQLADGDTAYGVIYYNIESRGYKTGFDAKGFYYLTQADKDGVFSIHGVTRDSRRKTFMDRVKSEGINLTIHNTELMDRWVS